MVGWPEYVEGKGWLVEGVKRAVEVALEDWDVSESSSSLVLFVHKLKT